MPSEDKRNFSLGVCQIFMGTETEQSLSQSIERHRSALAFKQCFYSNGMLYESTIMDLHYYFIILLKLATNILTLMGSKKEKGLFNEISTYSCL